MIKCVVLLVIRHYIQEVISHQIQYIHLTPLHIHIYFPPFDMGLRRSLLSYM